MTASQAQAEARELSRLATDEFSALPRGIGDIHAAIAGRVFGALGPSAAPVRVAHDALSRGVYAGVRGGLWLTAHAAGGRRRARGDTPLSETPRGAALIAALNGLYGDRLEAEGSALALPMRARRDRRATATPHLVVFVHGLGETEHAWGSPNYGERLAEELGCTPVYVRYNSGRHISENGASLGELLEELVAGWPVEVERIALVGHSMGGLVARSAVPSRRAAWVGARAPRRLARHAAHGRAAGAGRARAQRRAARSRRRRARSRASCAAAARASATCAAARSSTRTGATRTPTRCAPGRCAEVPLLRGRHALLRRGHDHPQRHAPGRAPARRRARAAPERLRPQPQPPDRLRRGVRR